MNAGDKVLMVNMESYWCGQVGEIVRDLDDSDFVTVRFPGGVSGHSDVSVLRDHVAPYTEPQRMTSSVTFPPELYAPATEGQIVNDRHPGSQRFHELVREIADLHDLKQRDYGSDNDPFANVRSSSDWGIPGWVGALVRLNDKVKRLQAFAQKGELANESAEDSMRDIAVYALIALVLYEQESSAD